MPRAHYLLRLPFSAVGSAPQSPFFFSADRVHRVPELCRDSGVGRVLQHPGSLSVLDLPSEFAAELEVVAFIVDRPRAIGL